MRALQPLGPLRGFGSLCISCRNIHNEYFEELFEMYVLHSHQLPLGVEVISTVRGLSEIF